MLDNLTFSRSAIEYNELRAQDLANDSGPLRKNMISLHALSELYAGTLLVCIKSDYNLKHLVSCLSCKAGTKVQTFKSLFI